MPIPTLPLLPPETSHLSQKYGRETANYFSGSPLNRLSFLRADPVFLRAAFAHPSARFLLLNSLAPLVRADDDRATLAFARVGDVIPLVGTAEERFGRSEEEMVAGFDSSVEEVVVVFLGVDEGGLVEDQEGNEEVFTYRDFKGAPYFAVDVTPRGGKASVAEELIAAVKGRGHVFHDNSPRHMGLVAGHGMFLSLIYPPTNRY